MTLFYQELVKSTQSEQEVLPLIAVIQKALNGQLSQQEYLRFLSQAYHHVRHTVPLLMACGSRLWPRHHWLQDALAEYIEEEIGHERWILNDIAACGGDPELIKSSVPFHETEMMVAYAYHQIDRGNPIGFFGMVHVLEGTSVALASRAAQAIQDSLKLPDAAFSYLRSHGSLDQEHVQFFEALINQVTHVGDQKAIVHCAKAFYRLYGDIFRAVTSNSN
jgi:pyrroloquinoline quinone (PQQ) biosynthesis protein C